MSFPVTLTVGCPSSGLDVPKGWKWRLSTGFSHPFPKLRLSRDRQLGSTPFRENPTRCATPLHSGQDSRAPPLWRRAVSDSRDPGGLSPWTSNLSGVCADDRGEETAPQVRFPFPGDGQAKGSVTQPLAPQARWGQKPLLLGFISWNKGCREMGQVPEDHPMSSSHFLSLCKAPL